MATSHQLRAAQSIRVPIIVYSYYVSALLIIAICIIIYLFIYLSFVKMVTKRIETEWHGRRVECHRNHHYQKSILSWPSVPRQARISFLMAIAHFFHSFILSLSIKGNIISNKMLTWFCFFLLASSKLPIWLQLHFFFSVASGIVFIRLDMDWYWRSCYVMINIDSWQWTKYIYIRLWATCNMACFSRIASSWNVATVDQLVSAWSIWVQQRLAWIRYNNDDIYFDSHETLIFQFFQWSTQFCCFCDQTIM